MCLILSVTARLCSWFNAKLLLWNRFIAPVTTDISYVSEQQRWARSSLLSLQSTALHPSFTGTLHGQSFDYACRPLTNRRGAIKVDNLQATRWLIKGRQAQAKACSCRVPVRDIAAYRAASFWRLRLRFLNLHPRSFEY